MQGLIDLVPILEHEREVNALAMRHEEQPQRRRLRALLSEELPDIQILNAQWRPGNADDIDVAGAEGPLTAQNDREQSVDQVRQALRQRQRCVHYLQEALDGLHELGVLLLHLDDLDFLVLQSSFQLLLRILELLLKLHVLLPDCLGLLFARVGQLLQLDLLNPYVGILLLL